MINKRRQANARGEVPERKSLLDYMIEISDAHPDFTEEDIINESCTFMLAVSFINSKFFIYHLNNYLKFQGQDSVGASMAFSIFLLTQNQEHQLKCVEEIDAIFEDDDRAPTMNDLREMKYLEMCIKEALR